MIIKVGNKYYYIGDKVARTILRRISDNKVHTIESIKDIKEQYGKRVYDILWTLNKEGIIDIKKTFTGKLLMKSRAKEVKYINILLIISIFTSAGIYLLSLLLIKQELFRYVGILIGLASTIEIILLLLSKKIFDDMETL